MYCLLPSLRTVSEPQASKGRNHVPDVSFTR